MSSEETKYELAKLRLLQYLSEPENAVHGALADRITSEVGPFRDRTANRRLLAELKEAQLIERITDPADRRAHPLFITEKGRDFLAEAMRKAVFPEMALRGDWAEQEAERDQSAQQDAASILRGLPEFQNSGEHRIQAVSRELVKALSQALARPAGPPR